MKRGKGGAPPTDLLVCFPSRTHLALMPKTVSSPVRPMELNKRRNHHPPPPHLHNLLNQQIVRSSNRGGQGSPQLWAKNKSMESDMDEPTSPKVTCAGQIKVKSKRNSNWQSVMEEIERIHHSSSTSTSSGNKHKKKKPTWVEALGLKKDVMTFLSCLRGMRIDLRCFGSFHHQTVLSSSDDEDDEDDSDQNHEPEKIQKGGGHEEEEENDGSGSTENVFSKWFMVLEENQNLGYKEDKDDEEELPCAPPPNALLLMRCRSAPAKSWLEEKLLLEQDEEEEDDGEVLKAKLDLEEKKNKESLVLKYYAPDFFKVSSDIAKETWVVGGTKDPLSRSRSWKR